MTEVLFNNADCQYMAEAIRLAWRGLYTTHPNPRVGCVIVKNGQIVGRGWHQVAGEGHAEINALKEAGNLAKGATAYVSLEPCSHHGKTPPCAEALIEAGVAKVISAMEDPNPLVSGRGHALLEENGIQTVSGLLQTQAERVNPGFIKRMRTGLPLVRLKSAMSVDGRVAMASGESKWITGPEARADVQRIRARSEAIVTGVDTVIADDPSFTVRPEDWPGGVAGEYDIDCQSWPAGIPVIQPTRVILDSTLRTPSSAALLSLPGKTVVVCTAERNVVAASSLESAGASIAILSTEPSKDGRERVSLTALLQWLAQQDVNEVMVEAGGTLAGCFIEQQLVDEWVVYMAPKIMGSTAQPLLALPDIQTMGQALPLDLSDVRQLGTDIRMTFRWSH